MIALLVACTPTPGVITLMPPDDVVTHTLAPLPLPGTNVMTASYTYIEAQPPVTWTVTPDSLARIDGKDIIPLTEGTATVQARAGDATASFTLNVSLPDLLAPVEVPTEIVLGGSPVRLQVFVMADGTALADVPVTWTSETPELVTIDATGEMTPISLGKAHLTAHAGALTRGFPVTVVGGIEGGILGSLSHGGVAWTGPGIGTLDVSISPNPPGPRIPSTLQLGDVTAPFEGGPKTVHKYVGQLKYCVESMAKSNPEFAGRLAFRMDVAAGRVTKVDVIDDTIAMEQLQTCMIAKVKRWTFLPEDAGTVTFNVVVKVPAPR